MPVTPVFTWLGCRAADGTAQHTQESAAGFARLIVVSNGAVKTGPWLRLTVERGYPTCLQERGAPEGAVA